jgi:diguanylate cyclase (GGDEF)-like protein
MIDDEASGKGTNERTDSGQAATARRAVAAPGAACASPGLALLAFEDDRLVAALPLGDEDIAFGRSPRCRVRLHGADISRRHCVLQREGGLWVLHDLDSANGTLVGGKAVRRAVVREGMQATLGEALLRFVRQDSPEWRSHRAMFEQLHSDELTGLLNRRGFRQRSDALLGALPAGSLVALLVIDIDRFKQVNDRFGHAAGDAGIRAVARSIEAALPEGGIAARLGGEEFCVLCSGAGFEALRAAAEGVRLTIQRQDLHLEAQAVRVTVSIGGAMEWAPIDSLQSLFTVADRALFEAKAGGRNRCVLRLGEVGHRPAPGWARES